MIFCTRPGRPRVPAAVTAVGAVGAAVLLLAGCEKPTPVATLTSGQDTVHTEADCYDKGRPIPRSALTRCLQSPGPGPVTLSVNPDTLLRIGVDPEIADHGWTFLMNGQPLTDVSTRTYRTIPASVFFSRQYGASGPTTKVSVLAGSGRTARGLWSFRLRKQT